MAGEAGLALLSRVRARARTWGSAGPPRLTQRAYLAPMRISAITCKRSNGKRTTERRRKRETTGEPEDRGAAGIQTDRDRGTQAEQQQDREQQREQSNEEEGK